MEKSRDAFIKKLQAIGFRWADQRLMPLLVSGIICCGILFRVISYLRNRSLWFDEAMLGVNIVERPFSGLFGLLDYFQIAPFGFLAIEKLNTVIFGPSEYALRLFPLIAGVLAVMLFWHVARGLLGARGAFAGLVMISVARTLIYYSSEVKQYSIDVCATLIILLLALEALRKGIPYTRIITLNLAGALLALLSHASIFVLVGAVCALMVELVYVKDFKKCILVFLSALSWVGVFMVTLSLQKFDRSGTTQFWQGAFVQFPPRSPSDILNIGQLLVTAFEYPAGFHFAGLAAFVALVGCISFLRKNLSRFVLLIFPILGVLGAAALHRYPFSGRLILFLVPVFIMLIIEGCRSLWGKPWYRKLLSVGIVIVLAFFPVGSAVKHVFFPASDEEIKPVLAYISYHKKKDDRLYLYYGAQPAFRYYHHRFSLEDLQVVNGIASRTTPGLYRDDLRRMTDPGRSWFLFSHIYDREDSLMLQSLDAMGNCTDSIKSAGAMAFAYDFK